MFKRKFYRSPDSDTATGTGTAAPAVAANNGDTKTAEPEKKVEAPRVRSLEDLLAMPNMVDSLEGDSLDTTKVKTKTPAAGDDEAAKKATEEAAKKKVPDTGKKKEDEPDDVTAKADTQAANKKKDEEGDTFTIEPPAIDADAEITTTWKETAKEVLGEEIADDDFEAFKTATTTRLKKEKEVGVEEGKKLAAKLELEKFTPAARDVIDFLNTPGNTIEAYITPLKVYDDYIKMENEALIKENLKAQKWEETAIDNHVKQLKEDGKIDSEAYAIRKNLENARDNEAARLVITARQKQDQVKNTIQQERQREDTQITEELSKLGPLLGGTLSKTAIENLQKKWKAGEYRERFKNDPAFVARMIAFAEYGESAETELRKKITTKKNEDLRKNLSNIDTPAGGGGGGRYETPKEGSANNDPFAAWEEGFSQKAAAV